MGIEEEHLNTKNTVKVLAWPKERNCKNNPYNQILYGAMPDGVTVNEFHPRKMLVGDESIFHIHWPDMILRNKRWWRIIWRFLRLQKAIKKVQKSGGKVVWTVHNLKPHQAFFPSLSDLLMRRFIDNIDGLIFLTESSRNEFLILYPEFEDIAFRIIPHAHYQSYYPLVNDGDCDKAKAVATDRQKLGLQDSDCLLLMFGKIRAHKGLSDLLAAKNTLNNPNLHLMIAGSTGGYHVDNSTFDSLEHDPQCHTVFEHIADEDVSAYFAAADAVILPYTDILNSGTAILALSFGVPIIAPALGSLVSLNKLFGDEWVFLYERPLSSETLDQALTWLKGRTVSEPDLSELAPELVANQTLSFYQELLG
ncbi:glycosyltransferase [Sessilibacter corallicola]|uniref:GDP-mannose--glycolipid 4-beta-D-mannosyltransferase n=1 Tax=Sessilibacter corallicola TaxID=2904075 RepID=A0ABQ0A6Y4_9GAMM